MKEDLNSKLCKFLIYKLGLDSLRNSASKLDFFPWYASTKSCCCSNMPWKCRPTVPKLVQSKSRGLVSRSNSIILPSSPSQVYFNRRDALRKSERFITSTTITHYESMLDDATMKISSCFDFPFSSSFAIVEQNDNSKDDCVAHQLGSEYSFDADFDGGFRNNQACSPSKLHEQDFPGYKDIMQLPTSSGLSLVNLDRKSNNDDDECWTTFNLITPRGGGASTVLIEDKREITITPGCHIGRNKASHYNKTAKLDESFKDILVAQKHILLEKSNSELDEFCVEDIEGESLVDKLRRQIEFDKKTIIKLYNEIDEERSAAAEAASQAMAMITKLQEEKALTDLDSLHCLRMMEEDAKHDSQALQQAYELLAEKEKEMQDLKAELKFYRSKYNIHYKEDEEQYLAGEEQGTRGFSYS